MQQYQASVHALQSQVAQLEQSPSKLGLTVLQEQPRWQTLLEEINSQVAEAENKICTVNARRVMSTLKQPEQAKLIEQILKQLRLEQQMRLNGEEQH